ncbi:MAG: 7-cyano-7-deazaguanine synthase, partial [Candidatus Omnitrophota bacterium]
MNKKAIVLLSGGLDSILAAKLMLEQGVEVLAVNFSAKLCMCGCKKTGESAAEASAKMLGITLKTIDITNDFIEIVKNPRHGHGANVNPCIDCKIYMLKYARKMMADTGASFLVTGEVLGERPMSQRMDALNLIEKSAGVRGLLLRPLTAKNMEPTKPELEGVVDREKLLDIRGRSRKPQMALAKEFGITDYPNPAGGCLLTDPEFAKRVKDAIKHDEFNTGNLALLSVGRHFRLSECT